MMDTDSSSEEHSSSECSTDSSDDDKLETVQVRGSQIEIPQGLCEKKEIFDEFFSVQTWNMLSEGHRQHLRRFLPKFPENDDQEKNATLQRLLTGEVFKFTSPLDNFYEHLKAGHYRPDIAKMRYLIRKAERKESIWRHKKHKEKLEAELIESRRNLLGQVSSLPPGVEPRLSKPVVSANANPIIHRTKRRYFQILSSIRSRVDESGFSSDDNYPDGAPAPVSRKQKRHLNTLKNSHVLNGERIVVATTALKPSGLDLERSVTPNYNPFVVTDHSYRGLLLDHKRRKLENDDDQELDTKGKNLTDIIHRTRLNYNKKLNKSENKMIRKKIKKELSPGYSSDSDSDSTINSAIPVKVKVKRVVKPASPKTIVPIKQEIKIEEPSCEQIKPIYNQFSKITPAPLEDFDSIDVMNIPIDLDDSNIDILDINNKAELMQDTHANFLALIRDIICSTSDHRMDMNALEDRLRTWQENPISALNDWYCLADNWTSQLPSAINFLSGNFPEQPDDFVPYLEYKPSINVYQWIGAGRDSDNSLSPLFQYWLDRKNDMKPIVVVKEKEDIDLDVMDRSQTPPPPRCPTNWTVRKADTEEIKMYRDQERRRYDNPHKAFTYRCNGYESVVGPLKGVYNPSAGNAKARGHTMLSADRPNFVTILSLVRDATARLPNGEGTRAEICELLKCSQYISSTAPDNVLQSVVSGALDRMHTQFDPCVKYDPKRKIWIYLHRNRSEEDFERLHQQYQGMNRNSKKPTKQKTPTKPKQAKVEKVIKNNVKSIIEPIEKKLPEVKQTSLLISHNSPKPIETSQDEVKRPKQVRQVSQEEKEINEALQAIVQNNTGKPKGGKSLVKIITSSQGKSLIIPSSTNTVIKHDNRAITTKVSQSPLVTQQLFQSLSQQKQIGTQQLIRVEMPESKEPKKGNISIQQQILQSISPQQLQNIKNVTLLRNVRHASPQNTQGQTIVLTQNDDQHNQIRTTAVCTQENKIDKIETSQPIRVQHSTLTLSQHQQLLQSIRQKGVQNITGQQQVLIRHKTPVLQKTMQAAPGTSLLGQTRVVSDISSTKPIMTTGQSPLVAKVLTNAAGQVISVESLLAHQKQHGTLPQGTTLRVSGVKGGTNIIQLAAPGSKSASMTQVVGSQNNFITLSNQPKLVLSSTPVSTTVTTSTVTPAKNITKTLTKPQGVAKFSQKVAQQIINAKFITQSADTQKLVQPKVLIGQNQIKLANKNVQSSKPVTLASNTNSIRMVNATNLNLAHLSGKPVLLASKGSTLQNIQGQNVIIQTQANTGSALMALSTSKNNSIPTQSVISQGGQMVFAPQLKMQPQVLLSSNMKNSGIVQNQSVSSGQIIVGGHPVRLQTTTASPKVVLAASQGQGGQIVAQQILLPAGFQGTAINIKSLQGVKVIPIAQQSKGIQGRPVFARVMNPSNIVRATPVPATDVTNTTPTTE